MALRITPNLSDRQFLRHHQASRNLETRILERLSSMKRINRPSDDPAGNAQALLNHQQLSENQGYKVAISDLMGQFSMVENALNHLVDLVHAAHEAAIQGASETTSASGRAAIAGELDQMREEMLAQLNTKHMGRWLFSGTASDVQAFDSTGLYQGNTDQRYVEINPSESVAALTIGSDLAYGTGGAGSSGDMLDLLSDLSTALNANNTAAIDGELGRFQAIRDRLNQELGSLGARSATLLREEERYGSYDLALAEILSQVEDADLAEEITDLQLNKTAIEAQLRGQSQMTRLNLFDFLG